MKKTIYNNYIKSLSQRSMTMKRFFVLMLAILLCLSGLVSCAADNTKDESGSNSTAEDAAVIYDFEKLKVALEKRGYEVTDIGELSGNDSENIEAFLARKKADNVGSGVVKYHTISFYQAKRDDEAVKIALRTTEEFVRSTMTSSISGTAVVVDYSDCAELDSRETVGEELCFYEVSATSKKDLLEAIAEIK